MVNKKQIISFMLTIMIVQGALFGMKKPEFSSDIYIPDEIWDTICGFSDLGIIKWLLVVSKQTNNVVNKNKNCIKTLKKYIRKQCYEKQNLTDYINTYPNSTNLFKNYSAKMQYLQKSNFFLRDIPWLSFIKNDQEGILNNFQTTMKNHNKNWNEISIGRVFSENNNFTATVKVIKNTKKKTNFIFFSFSDIHYLDSVLENIKEDIDQVKKEKNIIIVQTNKNDIKSKIFSSLPKELLQNTKMINFEKRMDIVELAQGVPEMIIPDQMQLCENVKVITMNKMNIKTLPFVSNFKKLRYLGLKGNEIIEFNETDLPKSLECLDLTDNDETKNFRATQSENGLVVKTGKMLVKTLFESSKTELRIFLDSHPKIFTTQIHQNNNQ